MSQYRNVCLAAEIPEGEARMFVVNETMVGVFNIEGQFFALDNQCPHAGASLAHGDIDGDTVGCRIHHWRFCIRDGTYLDEDKPRYNARTFRVRVVDGQVQVDVS
jgi:nitrite reductase (NADH) small subunit